MAGDEHTLLLVRVSGILGLASSLHRRKATPLWLRGAVRAGLPANTFDAVATETGVPVARLTLLLGIPPRTLARRKAAGLLAPEESDRLYRLARSYAQMVEVLGTAEKARHWLITPNRALGGEPPLDLLDTEIGARQVEEVLLRMEHGIFS